MDTMNNAMWDKVRFGLGEVNRSSDLNALDDSWRNFRSLVVACGDKHPYHLHSLISELDRYSNGATPRENITILDHGCGGLLTLFYLAALGYTDIYGVDIEDRNYEHLNSIANRCLGSECKRFSVYDGTTLPLPDNSVDVVFSQTVLEHVSPEQYEAYFSEELRVPKPGGIMLHDIPHRLGPYDSHTRTWLLHWLLPPVLWRQTLKMVGREPGVYIYLRWPWVHKRTARRYFGNVTDQSFHRISGMSSIPYFDGPLGLRRLIANFIQLPLVGVLAARALAPFAMLSIRSVKL